MITSSDVTVRGLDINGFASGAGIHITGTAATGNWIYGNLLGTDPTGTQAVPNNDGVEIDSGASDNLIGTNGDTKPGTGDGLMITSSDVTVRGLDINGFASGAGVHITGTAATGDWIYGNFLGTDPTGTQAAPNNYGVEIDSGASDNLIGTNGDGVNDAAEQNVVSGNSVAGVWINGRGTDGNVVAGNLIGTSVTGDTAVGNGSHPTGTIWSYYYGGGLLIQNGASGNLVGTDGRGVDIAGERNVISGNGDGGITIMGPGTSGNVVAGDLIGTSVSGDLALGNHSAMGWYYRYTQADGVMLVDGAALNTIGGTAPGTGCVISGNGGAGVEIAGSGTSGNVVEGNVIGTSVTGDTALPNGGGSFPAYYYYPSGTCDGAVDISGASSNTVGGTAAGAGNVISENYGAGVVVTGNGSAGDAIIGNSIYDNSGQAIDLGDDGVTYDATSPRQGPNNFQNFPLIFSVAGGGLEGSLAGSTPDATFLIDLYASTGYNSDGSGEAQDYLGSLDVTTDQAGQAVFAVPFTPPEGLPVVAATATDPQGNTSEVSALRQAFLEGPARYRAAWLRGRRKSSRRRRAMPSRGRTRTPGRSTRPGA